ERTEIFQHLLFECFDTLGFNWMEKDLTWGVVNYALHQKGLIQPILENKKVLVVGNKGYSLSRKLKKERVNIVDVIAPFNGIESIDDAVEASSNIDFDVALVAGGIASVSLCPKIAERTGKVVI